MAMDWNNMERGRCSTFVGCGASLDVKKHTSGYGLEIDLTSFSLPWTLHHSAIGGWV